MKHARLYEIMSGDAKGLPAALTRLGLAVLAPGYGLVMAIRNKLFDAGIKKSIKLDRPVISVGNITTGGTGKTPMVIELARRLIEQGEKPAILLRGYMAGKSEVNSDETLVLSQALRHQVPVMPDPDRVAGAKRVLAEHPETTVFLLDDGFQHRRVKRDLDIVLIDATRPFGFGRLLPRGLLRESLTGLRRADAVILTRCDLAPGEVLAELDRQIGSIVGQTPLLHSVQSWSDYLSMAGLLNTDYLEGKKVFGACAIGNPEVFEKMIHAAAGEVLEVRLFDDHHTFTKEEAHGLIRAATDRGADVVVVTEKDWVKLEPMICGDRAQGPPAVVRPRLAVRFADGDQAVRDLLWGVTGG